MSQDFDEELESYLSVPSLAERLKASRKPTNVVFDSNEVPQLKRCNNNVASSSNDVIVEDGDTTVEFITDTLSLEEYEKCLSPLVARDRSDTPSPERGHFSNEKSSTDNEVGVEKPELICRNSCSDSDLDLQSEFEAQKKTQQRSRLHKEDKQKRKQILTAEEKEELKQEKLREKAKKLAEKQREKALKSAERAVKKALKPGENLKYITAFVDSSIVTLWKDGEAVIRGLNESQVTFNLQSNLVPCSVTWEKKTLEHLISQDGKVTEKTATFDEDCVMLVVKFTDILEKIIGDSGSVDSYATELQNVFHNKKINLFITGMATYYKSKRNAANRDFRQIVRDEIAPTQNKRRKKEPPPFIPRDVVEDCLVELEITHSISHVHVDNAKDFTNFVVSYTKALADKDFKLNERQASFTFYSSSDMQPDIQSVKVDAAGNGLSRLWVNQIRQLPNVGLDTAQAIAAVYPLPACLKKAYDRCRNESEAKLLLQDIVVRRGAGALTSTRRVGPELSKKLHRLFTTVDGTISL